MEFHISRQSREKYQFDLEIFRSTGDAVIGDYRAAQIFAHQINTRRDVSAVPESAVHASDIYAMGLLDEIYHLILHQYELQTNSAALEKAYQSLVGDFSETQLYDSMVAFNTEFPPIKVFTGDVDVHEYLNRDEDHRSNKVHTVEEMLVLWLENQNPAFTPYKELFSDEELRKKTLYPSIEASLYNFFESQPKFGEKQLNIIEMLLEPARLYPNSLRDQLQYVQVHWSQFVGDLATRLLRSLDYIQEETKLYFGGPGESKVPEYEFVPGEDELIKFAEDRDWMSGLVLLAKNAYVWLDQLGKKYGRAIKYLNEIPDEELDELQRHGFTGLWLIGLWERSTASAIIKQMCGNPDAIASAYSLFSYDIAADLGGYLAYQNLRERAILRGIRLGSDMVPNHMGIDSLWVVNHPDWFVQLSYPPFPAYQFNGVDLSQDSKVSIYLEDHYYDRSDAAVVFRLRENWSGRERFIYHGNDGTSMPWNDTAQLNYLDPAVRKAVIDTIVEVAKLFPIIRFDAAMTLTKKHYQRLWYPEPGSGGDIPSRAEYGLTKDQFDQAMPEEFWREVVARIEQEAPDTLLLAEAFWLMEGYFVRSLGMHRVYNSAFMNMLRDEDNANYRKLIKKTLEFEPQILQRYVNFMNNPDERTAVDQYGKGDKYFGICVLMATFPGLPMFGHGQVEGFTEKYGMEFKRAYWDETPDQYLIDRHQRQIFPLLHRRYQFSSVDHFRLFDFYEEYGGVNENVYAYTNLSGDQRGLVIFHNQYAEAKGWLKTSAAYADKLPGEKEFSIKQCSLSEALNIKPDAASYILYRDILSDLEYIRPTKQIHEQGLYFDLHAYESHAFVDFREVRNDELHPYDELCAFLGGRGVKNIERALSDLALQPVKAPFREIANTGYINHLLSCCRKDTELVIGGDIPNEARQKMESLLNGIEFYAGRNQNRELIISGAVSSLKAVMTLSNQSGDLSLPGMRFYNDALKMMQDGFKTDEKPYIILLLWSFLRYLGLAAGSHHFEVTVQTWFDEWQLSTVCTEMLAEMGYSAGESQRMVETLRLLLSIQCWYERGERLPVKDIVQLWLNQPIIQRFIGQNLYDEILWFNNESFQDFEWWIVVITAVQALSTPQATATDLVEHTIGAYEVYQQLEEARKASKYQIQKLLSGIHQY